MKKYLGIIMTVLVLSIASDCLAESVRVKEIAVYSVPWNMEFRVGLTRDSIKKISTAKKRIIKDRLILSKFYSLYLGLSPYNLNRTNKSYDIRILIEINSSDSKTGSEYLSLPAPISYMIKNGVVCKVDENMFNLIRSLLPDDHKDILDQSLQHQK